MNFILQLKTYLYILFRVDENFFVSLFFVHPYKSRAHDTLLKFDGPLTMITIKCAQGFNNIPFLLLLRLACQLDYYTHKGTTESRTFSSHFFPFCSLLLRVFYSLALALFLFLVRVFLPLLYFLVAETVMCHFAHTAFDVYMLEIVTSHKRWCSKI